MVVEAYFDGAEAKSLIGIALKENSIMPTLYLGQTDGMVYLESESGRIQIYAQHVEGDIDKLSREFIPVYLDTWFDDLGPALFFVSLEEQYVQLGSIKASKY